MRFPMEFTQEIALCIRKRSRWKKLDSLIVSFPAVALLKFAEGVNLILWKKPFRSTFNPTIITENQFQMIWNTLIDFIMRYVNI